MIGNVTKIKIFWLMLMFLSPQLEKPVIASDTICKNDRCELKILSWNIFGLPSYLSPKGLGVRSKLIAEYLRDAEFDIVIFQEAFTSKSRGIIRTGIPRTAASTATSGSSLPIRCTSHFRSTRFSKPPDLTPTRRTSPTPPRKLASKCRRKMSGRRVPPSSCAPRCSTPTASRRSR